MTSALATLLVAAAALVASCAVLARADGDWDYAYFISGGKGGIFGDDDIGKRNDQVPGNAPDGADPSCGAKDYTTMALCITDDGAAAEYAVEYADAYAAAVDDECSLGDGVIQLVDTGTDGKVAVLEHGAYGELTPDCRTDHYDANVGEAAFKTMVNNITALMTECGTVRADDDVAPLHHEARGRPA